MDPDVKRALEAIDRVCETPTETGPVELDPEYLRAIERVESLPEDQSGTDKSWVGRILEESRNEWRRARRLE
jgi:hypothetical protein